MRRSVHLSLRRFGVLAAGVLWLPGCTQPRPVVEEAPVAAPARAEPFVGQVSPRRGDEIMVAGQLVHTGAPVVLWLDPPGYDGYRVTRRFAPPAEASWEASSDSSDSPNRYGDRPGKPEGGWTPASLVGVVDQFVLHYDVAGVSRSCFRVLHDIRGLSVHFMIDLDGTIYQTLDVKERAWHATIANDRSVGVEIANIGAYPPGSTTLADWYRADADGPRITLPAYLGDGGIRDKSAPMRPSRAAPVTGVVNGSALTQYDLTDAQYKSLASLSAALCTVLPRIAPDAPRDAAGRVTQQQLSVESFEAFSGILGHFHVQSNKVDPGPAFNWERLIRETRSLMGMSSTSQTQRADAGS
ncbi:MAG: N-acetylmuramoyl-L-alanine amidase [Phycisphaerales bacterium]|jgi:N-acetylmuramoyl-L-alanine amidase